ncbi:gluconokinase [Demequina sp. SYSU T00192]|uniref:Gluconokinase n=1 Tax=Demequina litoralis TaxID=3051660 RepID=A0ABT8GDT1_9MICO|nr:gluconokinase [Demequina sp. SYSU T00192]MDN4476824.1 gluconokinase [Demequina sp. SYSU T00192]
MVRETPLLVVMGPSATGKSTVGTALAAALGVPFVDGDDLHPEANVAKMAAGVPLEDADRWPWLDRIGATLDDAAAAGGAVVACSALKRAYRDRIVAAAPAARFVELAITEEEALRRSSARADHFMPPALVASQFATLEPLASGERGVRVDATAPVAEIVGSALASLR